MDEAIKYPEHMVFGLDIGTRSVVGTVGYLDRKTFKVAAQCVKYHDTRAMIDGQIHDITKVGQVIYQVKSELERNLGRSLNEVCIAAAGRVLKTVTKKVEQVFEEEHVVNQEDIYSLDMLGVEQAHAQLAEEETENIRFYCVGYTVIQYYMNDYIMNNLEGHKVRKIGASVLATFLPEEVVDSLYAAVKEADLQVASLTLEPIAAIQLAIPEQFRLLNIALVDIGAGTSDICITKDGSIVAYGMIPLAGDELTECLAKHYLTDFAAAEKIKIASSKKKLIVYKDIMGLVHKLTQEEVWEVLKPHLDRMAESISEKIKELNGGKPVSAIFVVGGGGKIPGFTDLLADEITIARERVALRGEEVMGNVEFLMQDIEKDSLLVTPIGICLNFYNEKNSFIFVYVNNERIKLYDNNKLTVMDAALQADIPNTSLFPQRGRDLNFKVNGKPRIVRGKVGEGAVITLEKDEASLQTPIHQNDRIFIKESTVGPDAACSIEKLPEYDGNVSFIVNEMKITCPKFAQVNGKLESGYYEIQEEDEIQFLNYYTVEQVMQFLDIDTDMLRIFVNNKLAELTDKVYENFSLRFERLTGTYADLVGDDGGML